ncbi:MAG: hypothetical protein AAF432_01895 [Planctomycetota bacterium]
MGRKSVLGTLVCGLAATAMMPNTAMAQDRVSASEKGSVLIFSKVEIRWDAAGILRQDTFIHLTNDFPGDVVVQMYFINGDAPLEADGAERAHPGWNWVDNRITLTGDQPVYWSAATGQPLGVSPFASALDPGFPPGRPCLDPQVAGERCMRGYIIAWAEDGQSGEINWNHLSGFGTLVNYANSYAWEYPAWAFQALAGTNGNSTGLTPGQLDLDGVEYDQGFDLLLLQFAADGGAAYAGNAPLLNELDITLHPIDADLRQETDGPVTVKASYEVWNSNEFKFSGLDRCVTCWDQTLASDYTDDGPSNHLILDNLQTAVGKARIDGLASQICDVDFDPANNDDFPFPPGPGDNIDPRDVVSQAASLLGVKAHLLTFGAAAAPNGAAGGNLVGMGVQSGAIIADQVAAPPSDERERTPLKDKTANDQFDGLVQTLFGRR